MSDVAPHDEPWATDVWAQIVGHIEAEKEIGAEYVELADLVKEPELQYLVKLIIDDEARHHRILTELANTLRAAHEWRPVEPSLPARTDAPLPPELLEATKRFLEVEREDARQLEALRKQLRPVASTTPWQLLVELMELDTKKHLRILQFIANRSKR